MATTLLAGDVRPSTVRSIAFGRFHTAPRPVRPAPALAWEAALGACRSTQRELHLAESRTDGSFEQACTAHAHAIDRLIITPAPDRAALLLKIEFMACEYAGFAIEAMMLGGLAADGRRLLALEA